MTKKKKKNIPFHVKHKFKSYTLKDGTIFWARDDSDAKLYSEKVGK